MRSTSFSVRRRYSIRSATVTICSPCRSQYSIEVGHAGHRPVVVHDLADDAGRVEPGEPREVDRRLGLPGALQDAAGARPEREDMAGLDEVVGALASGRSRPGSCARGRAAEIPVVDALARLDRDGEGGAERRLVALGHRPEAELVAPLAGEAEADQAASVRRHEVDRLGRRELRGDREVALVLAVGGVDDDDELALRGCPRSPPRSSRRRAVSPRASVSASSADVAGARAGPDEPLDVLGEHVDLEVDRVARAERAERRHLERVRDERDGEARRRRAPRP